MIDIPQDINSARIAEAIEALKQYINDSSVEPLLTTLEALQDEPDNESLFSAFAEAFAALGIVQGAVLTYAPYLGTIVPIDLDE